MQFKAANSRSRSLLAASTDAPRRTLLYVEDNPANMELVEEIAALLPEIGLVTAVDGTRGIEIARAILPSVILMDINLPGTSGIEALKILREDPSTMHIPVIALSANAMPRNRKWLGGGILPLSYQTDYHQRGHRNAQGGLGFYGKKTGPTR